MRTAVLPALALALVVAGCASGPPGLGIEEMFTSDWRLLRAEPHAALAPGWEVAIWSRGRGAERVLRRTLRNGEEQEAPGGVLELVEFCRAVDGPPAAESFADLAQLLRVRGVPVPGDPVSPDTSLAGPGASGRYSRNDAAAWNVPFDPPAMPHGGGWITQVIVAMPPQQHSELLFMSPWRVVQVRQVVYPDGAIAEVERRTLTNGEDAARYARF